jgi:hypothetical protein
MHNKKAVWRRVYPHGLAEEETSFVIVYGADHTGTDLQVVPGKRRVCAIHNPYLLAKPERSNASRSIALALFLTPAALTAHELYNAIVMPEADVCWIFITDESIGSDPKVDELNIFPKFRYGYGLCPV